MDGGAEPRRPLTRKIVVVGAVACALGLTAAVASQDVGPASSVLSQYYGPAGPAVAPRYSQVPSPAA